MTNNNDTTTSEDLCRIISSNLKRLITQKGITQKELADKLGVAYASMSDYCKGRRIPNVEFFIALANLYDISIDDFLTKSINPSAATLPKQETIIDPNLMRTYKKYCGTYYLFYFDTSKYKGRNTLPPKDSLLYGVLYIYENPSSLDESEFSCAAILGLKSKEMATEAKKKIDALNDPMVAIDYIDENYPNIAYYGDFELSLKNAFVSIRHTNMDKALAVFHRVDNNKENYIGGIGTVNSVSKGNERTPVIQFIGISRYDLTLSVEEIHHSLLLSNPSVKAAEEAEQMIQTFNALYMNPSDAMHELTDYQKTIIVRSTLERFITKNLERNVFRYGKISGYDDDEWYHTIKSAAIVES